VTDQELIAELQHEADHWARCATNCTNGIVKAAYTSRSDRIAAAAERIRVLGEFKRAWDAEMLKANVWRTDCGCRRTFEVMNNAARAATDAAGGGSR
jgi:hypothetical protein